MPAQTPWSSCTPAGLVAGRGLECRQPERDLRVRRHAPVPARRHGHGADLRPVRQARALELVAEEALEENAKPARQLLAPVLAVEARVLRQVEDLRGVGPEAHELVQEEVV